MMTAAPAEPLDGQKNFGYTLMPDACMPPPGVRLNHRCIKPSHLRRHLGACSLVLVVGEAIVLSPEPPKPSNEGTYHIRDPVNLKYIH